MADTGGKRYGDGCAGRERGGATTARAVCARVLQVVYHRPMGDCRSSGIGGYRTLRYWMPQAAIGNRRAPRCSLEDALLQFRGYRREYASGTSGH